MNGFPEPLAPELPNDTYVLRLYVTGNTPQSTRAIRNLKAICETHLKGRCAVTVVDLYLRQESAQADQIVVAPTLVKLLPLPLRRLIGDLSQTARVLAALGITPVQPEEPS